MVQAERPCTSPDKPPIRGIPLYPPPHYNSPCLEPGLVPVEITTATPDELRDGGWQVNDDLAGVYVETARVDALWAEDPEMFAEHPLRLNALVLCKTQDGEGYDFFHLYKEQSQYFYDPYQLTTLTGGRATVDGGGERLVLSWVAAVTEGDERRTAADDMWAADIVFRLAWFSEGEFHLEDEANEMIFKPIKGPQENREGYYYTSEAEIWAEIERLKPELM
jgi:hypothetical protein